MLICKSKEILKSFKVECLQVFPEQNIMNLEAEITEFEKQSPS